MALGAPASLAMGLPVVMDPNKTREAHNMFPRPHNPLQWIAATGYARQACARIFRDGGKPADALAAFGLAAPTGRLDWSVAVDRIAELLCAPRLGTAASRAA